MDSCVQLCQGGAVSSRVACSEEEERGELGDKLTQPDKPAEEGGQS